MKPIHLNLAARPYRDYRPVYAAAAVMGILTAFLLINNAQTYYRYKHDTRSTVTKIDEAEARTRRERELAQSIQHRLGTLDLTRLDAQTRYVNDRLAERAFSWSTLLDELESVLPDDVRVVSITPSFAPEGPIAVNLRMQSKSPTGMIDTINRMHGDPQFADPFPSSESLQGDTYQFQMTVDYLPPNEPASGRAVERPSTPKPGRPAARPLDGSTARQPVGRGGPR